MVVPNVIGYVPRMIELLLVLLVAWAIAGFVVESEDFQVSNSFEMPSENAEINMGTTPVKGMFQVNLFGQGDAVVKQKQEVVRDNPIVDSRLNIKLVGTVVAGKKSAAMVTVGGSRKQSVFFLEEEIQPDVTLKEVEVTEIVVDNRGKHERISIEKGKTLASMPQTANRSRVARTPKAPAQLVNRKINRNKLQSQMRNFSTLLSQARVIPHFKDKKPDGFMITDIVKGSLYEEIGLLNGDVIKKVNGESVTGAEQAMRMYRELQNATFIDVEVERAGTIQQISYVIQ